MLKKLICYFFIGSSFLFAHAQEVIQLEEIENKSYQLYNEKKWSQLSALVNSAINQNIDYYYLRIRAGIAQFEQKNYTAAEIHFKKALEFNSTDDLAKSYLYYSLINNGLDAEASILTKNFSDSLNKEISKNQLNFLLLLESGTKLNNVNTYIDPLSGLQKNYFDPAFYFHLGFKHRINKRITLFHAFTNYKQTTYLGQVNQNQYYLNGNVILKNQWSISPAFHTYNLKFVGKKTIYDPNTYLIKEQRDTNYPNVNAYIMALAINKRVNKFSFSIGTCFVQNNTYKQFIQSAMLSYAVFGNQKLIIGSQFYLNNKDTNSTLYSSIAPFIYVQAIPKLSFKASYINNKGNNIIEDNAYLLNNSLDLTTERWSLITNFEINSHISIYGIYQIERKKELYQNFNYLYNVLIAGIKIGL